MMVLLRFLFIYGVTFYVRCNFVVRILVRFFLSVYSEINLLIMCHCPSLLYIPFFVLISFDGDTCEFSCESVLNLLLFYYGLSFCVQCNFWGWVFFYSLSYLNAVIWIFSDTLVSVWDNLNDFIFPRCFVWWLCFILFALWFIWSWFNFFNLRWWHLYNYCLWCLYWTFGLKLCLIFLTFRTFEVLVWILIYFAVLRCPVLVFPYLVWRYLTLFIHEMSSVLYFIKIVLF